MFRALAIPGDDQSAVFERGTSLRCGSADYASAREARAGRSLMIQTTFFLIHRETVGLEVEEQLGFPGGIVIFLSERVSLRYGLEPVGTQPLNLLPGFLET